MQLRSPASPASIRRLPGSPDLLAVYNDHSGQFKFEPKKRTPLVVAYSSDGGRTWPVRQVLEDDPTGWYCYTAIHYTGEGVLLACCASNQQLPHLSRLRHPLGAVVVVSHPDTGRQIARASGMQGRHP